MDNHKYHLVSWGQVYKPKGQGGLGVINLETFTKAFLLKWWWEILSRQEGRTR